jgi:hypothetical protein
MQGAGWYCAPGDIQAKGYNVHEMCLCGVRDSRTMAPPHTYPVSHKTAICRAIVAFGLWLSIESRHAAYFKLPRRPARPCIMCTLFPLWIGWWIFKTPTQAAPRCTLHTYVRTLWSFLLARSPAVQRKRAVFALAAPLHGGGAHTAERCFLKLLHFTP